MTTTDQWREANRQGTVHLHESTRWTLVHLDRADGTGWYLFGPGADGVRVDPGGCSPALDLLLASRAADSYIAAAVGNEVNDQGGRYT